MFEDWKRYTFHDIKAAKIINVIWKNQGIVGIGDEYEIQVEYGSPIRLNSIKFQGKWPLPGDYFVVFEGHIKILPPHMFGQQYVYNLRESDAKLS